MDETAWLSERFGEHAPETDLTRQRTVVDAFFAVARDADFDALIGMLDPDVVLRIDGGTALPAASMLLRGPRRSPAKPAGVYGRCSLARACGCVPRL